MTLEQISTIINLKLRSFDNFGVRGEIDWLLDNGYITLVVGKSLTSNIATDYLLTDKANNLLETLCVSSKIFDNASDFSKKATGIFTKFRDSSGDLLHKVADNIKKR